MEQTVMVPRAALERIRDGRCPLISVRDWASDVLATSAAPPVSEQCSGSRSAGEVSGKMGEAGTPQRTVWVAGCAERDLAAAAEHPDTMPNWVRGTMRDGAEALRHLRALATPSTDVTPSPQGSSPEQMRSVELAKMYLETGFLECDRCGNEIPTKTTDAYYELERALTPAPLPSPVEGEQVERAIRAGVAALGSTSTTAPTCRIDKTTLLTLIDVARGRRVTPSPQGSSPEQMREALEPFATAAETIRLMTIDTSDDERLGSITRVCVGDLRRAKVAYDALLASSPVEGEQVVTDAIVMAHHRYRNLHEDFVAVETDLRNCALLIGHHYNSGRPVADKLKDVLATPSLREALEEVARHFRRMDEIDRRTGGGGSYREMADLCDAALSNEESGR